MDWRPDQHKKELFGEEKFNPRMMNTGVKKFSRNHKEAWK
jgi:hypothetical protein